MSATLYADGSSPVDAHERVRVDRQAEPYRWVCPQGHASWERTNSHGWCPQCRRLHEHDPDVDPEHYEIVDKKTGEAIPYEAIEFVSGD